MMISCAKEHQCICMIGWSPLMLQSKASTQVHQLKSKQWNASACKMHTPWLDWCAEARTANLTKCH